MYTTPIPHARNYPIINSFQPIPISFGVFNVSGQNSGFQVTPRPTGRITEERHQICCFVCHKTAHPNFRRAAYWVFYKKITECNIFFRWTQPPLCAGKSCSQGFVFPFNLLTMPVLYYFCWLFQRCARFQWKYHQRLSLWLPLKQARSFDHQICPICDILILVDSRCRQCRHFSFAHSAPSVPSAPMIMDSSPSCQGWVEL